MNSYDKNTCLHWDKMLFPQTATMTDQSTVEILLHVYTKKKDLDTNLCLNPLMDILPKSLAKQFASLSESQLDELMSKRHSKNTVARCFCYVMKPN